MNANCAVGGIFRNEKGSQTAVGVNGLTVGSRFLEPLPRRGGLMKGNMETTKDILALLIVSPLILCALIVCLVLSPLIILGIAGQWAIDRIKTRAEI